MACLDFNEFNRFILAIDQKTAIDKDKDKDLRYNVWETTQKEIKELTSELSTKVLPDETQSLRILDKLKGSLKRIKDSSAKGGTFQKDIMDHAFNKEMAIGLHEFMESVKGEADKARNLGIEVTNISDTGVLPALPLSRIAASIGRKIAFQKGFRFKRAYDEDTSARIEAMYYDIGREALSQLQIQGYVKLHKLDDGIHTVMDYQNKKDLKKDFFKNDPTRNDVLAVSLNESKLGIKEGTEESGYFLKRTDADLSDTNLGVITDKLRSANMLLEPATVVLPDDSETAKNKSDEDLAQWDDGINEPDPKMSKARKLLYDNPLRVNKSMHGLLQLLNEEVKRTGLPASKIIGKVFGGRKNMIRSLFGLKRSDDFSIDKKESITGQNLSKTTPLDDYAEYYDLMQENGEPAPLHMPLKLGRNGRLYYLNSVLNAHSSKQSRFALTPGEYTVDTKTDDFKWLAYSIHKAIKTKDFEFDFDEITGNKPNEVLDKSLAIYQEYKNAKSFNEKLFALGKLTKSLPGVDYVTMVTGLQAIEDLRNPKGDTITTEFPMSADATAQGGTLTLMYALGTNPNVTELLQRIGILKSDQLVKKDLDDLYGLMTEAVDKFLKGDLDAGLGEDLGETDITEMLQDTIDMLFLRQGKDVREFSKDPTMTFVYGQGRTGSVETLSRSLADRIIDNLDDPNTREYLTKLFNDEKFDKLEGKALKNEKDLYKEIVQKLKDTDLPGVIFDIMETNIKNKFLKEYTDQAQEVYDIVKQLPNDKPFKVLTLGAVLSDKKASNPGDLETYGMPLTKKVEVLNKFDGKPDTVLTRVEKPQKTVADVSTVHATDAGLIYHSIADINPKDGIVVVHDQAIGSIQTIRALVKQYGKKAKEAAFKYDIHQQIMESVAAQSSEIASSAEFKALKTKIDNNVKEKRRIINELFDEETDALIGDGEDFKKFTNQEAEAKTATNEAEVDTKQETPVKSTSSKTGTPLAKQDFGNVFITITEGNESTQANAQEYWNNIQSRLNMVEDLKVCLKG